MCLQSATTFPLKHLLIWSSYQILQCEAVTTHLLRMFYHLVWGCIQVINPLDLVELQSSLSMMLNVTSMLRWFKTQMVLWKISRHSNWVDILTSDWLLCSHNIIEVGASRLTKVIPWLQMMSSKAWVNSKRNSGSTTIALRLYHQLWIGNVLTNHLLIILWLFRPSKKRSMHNGWNANSRSKTK